MAVTVAVAVESGFEPLASEVEGPEAASSLTAKTTLRL